MYSGNKFPTWPFSAVASTSTSSPRFMPTMYPDSICPSSAVRSPWEGYAAVQRYFLPTFTWNRRDLWHVWDCVPAAQARTLAGQAISVSNRGPQTQSGGGRLCRIPHTGVSVHAAHFANEIRSKCLRNLVPMVNSGSDFQEGSHATQWRSPQTFHILQSATISLVGSVVGLPPDMSRKLCHWDSASLAGLLLRLDGAPPCWTSFAIMACCMALSKNQWEKNSSVHLSLQTNKWLQHSSKMLVDLFF